MIRHSLTLTTVGSCFRMLSKTIISPKKISDFFFDILVSTRLTKMIIWTGYLKW